MVSLQDQMTDSWQDFMIETPHYDKILYLINGAGSVAAVAAASECCNRALLLQKAFLELGIPEFSKLVTEAWTKYGGGHSPGQVSEMIKVSEGYVTASSVWNLILKRGKKSNAASRRGLAREKKKELKENDLALDPKLAEHLDTFVRDGCPS